MLRERNEDYDVLVLGSGCAGLAAALHASTSGLKVLVCEKTSKLGGTSAMSAGGVWVPANHHGLEAGIDDTPQEALDYIAAISPEGWDDWPLWKSLVDAAPAMLMSIEKHSPLRFRLTREPDPYPAVKGSRPRGRMVSPMPVSRWTAKQYAFKVRGSTLPELFTYHEVLDTDLYHKPIRTSLSLLPRLIWRFLTSSAGKGTALMLGLVRGCLDHGVDFELKARGVELTTLD
ncbi:FAD-dependent oxidoreductase, partial [Rhizobiaceae sp. 2RAB30]